MREFAIEFEKGLKKGLRAYPNAPRDDRECVECYNLAPSEHQLIAHEPVVGMIFEEIDPSTLLNGLLAYWKMDEITGIRRDAFGDSHLSLYEPNENFPVSVGDPGKIRKAAYFESSTNNLPVTYTYNGLYRAHTDLLSFFDTSFAVNLWFLYAAPWPATNLHVIRKGQFKPIYNAAISPFLFSLILQGSSFGPSTFNLNFTTEGTTEYREITFGASHTNVWHMLYFEYDEVTDDVAVSLSVASFNQYTENLLNIGTFPLITAPLVFGNSDDGVGTAPDLQVDEVGIWSRTLTLDEREELWNAGTGRTYPFVPFI